MNSQVGHPLTGYDRDTELLAVEYDIRPKVFSKVKKIPRVGPCGNRWLIFCFEHGDEGDVLDVDFEDYH